MWPLNKEELHLKPKLSIKLCALSRNYQHFFEKYCNPEEYCVRNTNMALKFQYVKRFLSYWWKQVQKAQNVVMINNSSQEPLGLLKLLCHVWVSQAICFRTLVLCFKKSVANFEIAHIYAMLNFDLRCRSPSSTSELFNYLHTKFK